jgi:hypothetical protein
VGRQNCPMPVGTVCQFPAAPTVFAPPLTATRCLAPVDSGKSLHEAAATDGHQSAVDAKEDAYSDAGLGATR